VTASTIVDIYGVGAALLALWVTARFPSFGPSGAVGSLAAMAAAAALMSLCLSLEDPVAASGRFGPLLAALFLLLPTLTAAFWAVGRLLRTLVALGR
jgi:hypothetical protein